MSTQDLIATYEAFKGEVENMKKEAQPGDTIPAEVFFNFMDILTNVFDRLVQENEKDK